MPKLNHKVKPEHDVIVTELDNKEAVLLNLATKRYYTLNETGLHIWQLFNNGLMLGKVSEKLQEKFDITTEKAKEGVLNLIDELITEKLVKVEND